MTEATTTLTRAGSVAAAFTVEMAASASNKLRKSLMSNLTPELSRTAARNGGVVHVTM